jgi:hypothetical protein
MVRIIEEISEEGAVDGLEPAHGEADVAGIANRHRELDAYLAR